MKRTLTESDLVMPTLRALVKHRNTGLSTTQLQTILRDKLKPEGNDLVLLCGRGDDKFSQKVRNLKSHNRLERDQLAVFDDGKYHITMAGKKFIAGFSGVDESYSLQGFPEVEKSAALQSDKIFAFIEEGNTSRVNRTVRRRSKRLREYAVKHFADENGKIECEGCGFEASSTYGEKALGLIEIHHKKPIAISGKILKPLAEAVYDLSPLCPTCHRIVHMRASSIISIEELRQMIA